MSLLVVLEMRFPVHSLHFLLPLSLRGLNCDSQLFVCIKYSRNVQIFKQVLNGSIVSIVTATSVIGGFCFSIVGSVVLCI